MYKNKNSTPFYVYLLLVAGVTIAGPRVVGAFGQAIGIDVLERYPGFADIEIFSGWALAVLEGIAIAYIAHSWKRIQLFDDRKTGEWYERLIIQNAIYWLILLASQFILLVSLPFVSTAYLIASQFGVPAREVLTLNHIGTNFLVWAWSFAVAGVPTLIVFAVGIVIDEMAPSVTESVAKDRTDLLGRLFPKTTVAPPPVPIRSTVMDIEGFVRAARAAMSTRVRISHHLLTSLATQHNIPPLEAEKIIEELTEEHAVNNGKA